MKTCTSCLQSKTLEEFGKCRSAKDGLNWVCKLCQRSKAKEYREANPEKYKASRDAYRTKNPNSHRKDALAKYGVTQSDYDQMLFDQNGKCGICGRKEADSVKKFLCVDHIAGTLKIRGLLCSQCNSAIGLLQHNPTLLLAAISWVEKEPAMEGVKRVRE